MKKTTRKIKNLKKLTEDILEYYFNNPQSNSIKEMQDKFKVSHDRVRRIISKELQRRLDNSVAKRCLAISLNK